ncbi:transposase [Pseudomonas fluorescens]|uniref:transposase n=1 Tax=Pseudomonas fluorescens TaxID=294 RepID=UPI00398FF497
MLPRVRPPLKLTTFEIKLLQQTWHGGLSALTNGQRLLRHQTQAETRPPTAIRQTKYRERDVIERLFGWLKEHRRLATRYCKLTISYLTMVTLACCRISLRTVPRKKLQQYRCRSFAWTG